MLFQIDHEDQVSHYELSTFVNESSMVLGPSSDSQPRRQRRGADEGLAGFWRGSPLWRWCCHG